MPVRVLQVSLLPTPRHHFWLLEKLDPRRLWPVLLTGYGGFDLSETPSYSSFYVLRAEPGGIVANVNLRGGGEFGEAWHRAGMLQNKQNVFDDFIAAAEFLIANKYTNLARLAIRGVSNGGLLADEAQRRREAGLAGLGRFYGINAEEMARLLGITPGLLETPRRGFRLNVGVPGVGSVGYG